MRQKHNIGMCEYDYDDNRNITIWYDSKVAYNNTEYIFGPDITNQIMTDHRLVDEWNQQDKRLKKVFTDILVLKLWEDKVITQLPTLSTVVSGVPSLQNRTRTERPIFMKSEDAWV